MRQCRRQWMDHGRTLLGCYSLIIISQWMPWHIAWLGTNYLFVLYFIICRLCWCQEGHPDPNVQLTKNKFLEIRQMHASIDYRLYWFHHHHHHYHKRFMSALPVDPQRRPKSIGTVRARQVRHKTKINFQHSLSTRRPCRHPQPPSTSLSPCIPVNRHLHMQIPILQQLNRKTVLKWLGWPTTHRHHHHDGDDD